MKLGSLLIFFPLLIWAEGSRLYIGPNIFYRDYHEKLCLPAKSDEKGVLYGFQAGYDYERPKWIYFGVNFSPSWGTTDYDGAMQDLKTEEITPHLDDTRNFFLNAEGRVGYSFAPQEKMLLSVFGAFGYFLWCRDIDYMEYYEWEYLGIGARFNWRVKENIEVGLRALVSRMIDGRIQIVDRESDLTLALGNRYHYSFELPVTRVYSQWDLRLVPYFLKQNIGKSETGTACYKEFGEFKISEPESRTYVVGGRLEIGFRL